MSGNHLENLPNDLLDVIYKMKQQLERDELYKNNMTNLLVQLKYMVSYASHYGGFKPAVLHWLKIEEEFEMSRIEDEYDLSYMEEEYEWMRQCNI